MIVIITRKNTKNSLTMKIIIFWNLILTSKRRIRKKQNKIRVKIKNFNLKKSIKNRNNNKFKIPKIKKLVINKKKAILVIMIFWILICSNRQKKLKNKKIIPITIFQIQTYQKLLKKVKNKKEIAVVVMIFQA